MIRKIYSFLILNKRAEVVCEVSFWEKQNIEFLKIWPLPL